MRKEWEPKEDKILKEFASKKTQEEIGIILGRSAQSIANRAYRLKVSMVKKGQNHHDVKLSDMQVEIARALNESGFNACEIHRCCFSHVSLSAVQKIVFFKSRRG